MSTRTTGKRETLEERVKRRPLGVWPFHQIVRAELQRVARQVRRLKRRSSERILTPSPYMSYLAGIDDVLALLKEAKK